MVMEMEHQGRSYLTKVDLDFFGRDLGFVVNKGFERDEII